VLWVNTPATFQPATVGASVCDQRAGVVNRLSAEQCLQHARLLEIVDRTGDRILIDNGEIGLHIGREIPDIVPTHHAGCITCHHGKRFEAADLLVRAGIAIAGLPELVRQG
jgi:hypothetical protein